SNGGGWSKAGSSGGCASSSTECGTATITPLRSISTGANRGQSTIACAWSSAATARTAPERCRKSRSATTTQSSSPTVWTTSLGSSALTPSTVAPSVRWYHDRAAADEASDDQRVAG